MSKTVRRHRHNFKVWTTGVPMWEYRCKCKEVIAHPPSPQEKRAYDARNRKHDREVEIMHRVSHDFDKNFREGRAWKWQGFELQTRIDEWAKKYPKDVFCCGIDDSHFTTSDVWLILHRVGKRLWGTTAIVVTQCDGQPPCEFFLYPGHMEHMRDVFNGIIKNSEPFDQIAAHLKRLRAKLRRKKK